MNRRTQAILAALAAVLAVVLMLSGCASRPAIKRQAPAPMPHSAPTAQDDSHTGKAAAPATYTADLRWPAVTFVPGYEIFFTPALTQPFTQVAETGGQTNVTIPGLPAIGFFNVQVMKRYGQP